MAKKVYTQDTSGEAKTIFLEKLKRRIDSGEFDEKLNIPFANREALYKMAYGKINDKLSTGATPALTDKEIKNLVEDLRITSAETFHVLKEEGFFEQNDEGRVILSKKGKMAMRQVPLL